MYVTNEKYYPNFTKEISNYEKNDLSVVNTLLVSYCSLVIGAWGFISHLVTLTLSFEEIKNVAAYIVFWHITVKASHSGL